MNCPCCQSSKNVKAGFQNKKQRRKCKNCGRLFVKLSPRGFSPEIKAQAVSLYLEGLGFRAIGRLLGVSNVAVLKWIKAAADALPKPIKPAVVEVLELDELWHFVKKRVKHSGCGLRLIVNETPLLTSRQVAVVHRL